jgi:sugar lactone lactonase YvrE
MWRGNWLTASIVLLACSVLTSAAVAQDMRLGDLLIDGEGWELVGEGYTFTEGPAADLQGNLYFTDTFRGKIHRVNTEGKVEVFVDKSGGCNGLMFGPDGRLYGCQNGKKRIVAYDSAGKESVIAEDVQSNDIVVMHNGGIYFTDPPNHQVWYIAPSGEKRVVDKGLGYPNGLILTPDESTLVVVDMRSADVYAYRIATNGDLQLRQAFWTLRTLPGKLDCGADGMTVDSAGRIYVATQLGLQVLDSSGRLGGVIDKPQQAWLANVAFAGPKLDTIYAACTNRVYKRKLNAQGVRYFDPQAAKSAAAQ